MRRHAAAPHRHRTSAATSPTHDHRLGTPTLLLICIAQAIPFHPSFHNLSMFPSAFRALLLVVCLSSLALSSHVLDHAEQRASSSVTAAAERTQLALINASLSVLPPPLPSPAPASVVGVAHGVVQGPAAEFVDADALAEINAAPNASRALPVTELAPVQQQRRSSPITRVSSANWQAPHPLCSRRNPPFLTPCTDSAHCALHCRPCGSSSSSPSFRCCASAASATRRTRCAAAAVATWTARGWAAAEASVACCERGRANSAAGGTERGDGWMRLHERHSPLRVLGPVRVDTKKALRKVRRRLYRSAASLAVVRCRCCSLLL